MPASLSFRQVHLDFHTSEAIPNVGADFDPDVFADTLLNAHVDSINLFGRCHHGWLYYDSVKFPELVHPNLVNKNLLLEQMQACQVRGICTPVYFTIQWDYHSALTHPEWLTIGVDGKVIGPVQKPFEAGFWRFLCVNSPYRQFLKEHLAEAIELLPLDGLWLDIVQPVECVCQHCQKLMMADGLDPQDPADRAKFAVDSINAFKRDMTTFVRERNQNCLIFYNAGHIGPRYRTILDAYTHLELESLPSGGWGYIHFPLTVRYARNLGLDCLGMTGKFHTSWGDFHSFKNLAALQYEVFLMLALNAKCCVGDQLHPSGAISPATYDLIGKVYAEVKDKEPWCVDALPVTEIGLLTPEEFHGGGIGGLPPALMGAVRMLTELSYQFDVLDSHSDFSRYAVLVLPDEIPLDETLAEGLKDYLADGGKILASYHSGLTPNGSEFALDEFGLRLVGDAPYSPDFLMPTSFMGNDLPQTEHVHYLPGLEVEAQRGAVILSETYVPYFNRTYRHFCSHRHAPSTEKPGYPGITKHGEVIYFTHPIFTQYNDCAPLWVKSFAKDALRQLLPEPLLCHNGPSTLVTALNVQPVQNRIVLHLLHYIPERRGQAFDTVEDVISLYNLDLYLRIANKVGAVKLVPQQEDLTYIQENGRVSFQLPKLEGHQMVAIELVWDS